MFMRNKLITNSSSCSFVAFGAQFTLDQGASICKLLVNKYPEKAKKTLQTYHCKVDEGNLFDCLAKHNLNYFFIEDIIPSHLYLEIPNTNDYFYINIRSFGIYLDNNGNIKTKEDQQLKNGYSELKAFLRDINDKNTEIKLHYREWNGG